MSTRCLGTCHVPVALFYIGFSGNVKMIGVDAHVFMTLTSLVVVNPLQSSDYPGAFQMQPMEPYVQPTVQPTAPPLWPVQFYGSSSDSFSVVPRSPSDIVSVVPMSSGQAFSTF